MYALSNERLEDTTSLGLAAIRYTRESITTGKRVKKLPDLEQLDEWTNLNKAQYDRKLNYEWRRA